MLGETGEADDTLSNATKEQEEQYIQILDLLDCAKRTTILESACYQKLIDNNPLTPTPKTQNPPSAVLTTSSFRSLTL